MLNFNKIKNWNLLKFLETKFIFRLHIIIYKFTHPNLIKSRFDIYNLISKFVINELIVRSRFDVYNLISKLVISELIVDLCMSRYKVDNNFKNMFI